MTRKQLKPVTLTCFIGNSIYKQTVYGRHIRFAFLPGELFVLHPGSKANYTLTHYTSGLAVVQNTEYGECLQEACVKLRVACKVQPNHWWIRKIKREYKKYYKDFKH